MGSEGPPCLLQGLWGLEFTETGWGIAPEWKKRPNQAGPQNKDL